MVVTPSDAAEGHHGEKRVRRHSRHYAPRTSTQGSPLVIVLAVVGAVLLVMGAIAGAMYFNKPAPGSGTKLPSVPAQEAPAPTDAAQR